MRVPLEQQYPQAPIDIVLLTCNRLPITQTTITDLYDRLRFTDKIRLIVVDDNSVDGTYEYLESLKSAGLVHTLLRSEGHKKISEAYNWGFEHVRSEYFITMQDDITIPRLQPDIIIQLQELMERYPEQVAIGCRIQRIPNINWKKGNDDLVPARKALSAYFRIQTATDYKAMGGMQPRDWDDLAYVNAARQLPGRDLSWAKHLWADHSRGYCANRGYVVKPRAWGTDIHGRRAQDHVAKPYPAIDPDTNIPLDPNYKHL